MAKQPTTMRLKLLIDAPSKRVILAEVEKDFVDFLYCIMSLPVANVVGLVGKDAAALGSVSNLHASTKNLKSCFLPAADTFLKPKPNPSLLSPPPEKHKCAECTRFSSNPNSYFYGLPCHDCQALQRKRTANGSGGGGFVKDFVPYMVMDDLSVMPLSIASTINVMNKLNADKFLKASLESKSVLTDFFLKDAFGNFNGKPPRNVKREASSRVDNTTRVKKERVV